MHQITVSATNFLVIINQLILMYFQLSTAVNMAQNIICFITFEPLVQIRQFKS